jgi:hypothetical protein
MVGSGVQTLNVKVYDEGRRLSPALSRSQAQYVLTTVLLWLYRASGGHLATAEVSLVQGRWRRKYRSPGSG